MYLHYSLFILFLLICRKIVCYSKITFKIKKCVMCLLLGKKEEVVEKNEKDFLRKLMDPTNLNTMFLQNSYKW